MIYTLFVYKKKICSNRTQNLFTIFQKITRMVMLYEQKRKFSFVTTSRIIWKQ
ncbi:hypothetical protein pb186bvf_005223 [Paramecium bursaria]